MFQRAIGRRVDIALADLRLAGFVVRSVPEPRERTAGNLGAWLFARLVSVGSLRAFLIEPPDGRGGRVNHTLSRYFSPSRPIRGRAAPEVWLDIGC